MTDRGKNVEGKTKMKEGKRRRKRSRKR